MLPLTDSTDKRECLSCTEEGNECTLEPKKQTVTPPN